MAIRPLLPSPLAAPSPLWVCVGAVCVLVVTACGEEEEPPPPSTPPTIEAPQVECGELGEEMSALYDLDYPVLQQVSVEVSDPERDLLDASLRGSVNGYPMTGFTDEDADLRYTWTPPEGLDPMVCQGEVVLRFMARDLDGNVAELNEIVTK